MSVLARLALRAIGATGQVRPRISGLFERGMPGPAEMFNAMTAAPVLSAIAEGAPPMTAVAQGEPPGELAGPMASRPGRKAGSESGRRMVAAAPAGSLSDSDAPLRSDAGATDRLDDAPSESKRFQPAAAPAGPIAGYPPGVDAPVAAAPALQSRPYRPLVPEFAALRRPAPPAESRGESAGRGEAEIHISIGRIEVRGEPERRRPAPAPRPGPQLMSLEDYLARGRRR